MSTWTRGEHTVTTVEFTVPADPKWGAAWTEVSNAISAALSEFSDHDRRKVFDDSIRVFARDDAIVISYEKTPELVEQ